MCRIWLQIKSCRECLFDAFCSLEDRKKETLEDNNKSEIIELIQKQSLKDFLDYEEFEIVDIDSWD